jgi:hypothetical protein
MRRVQKLRDEGEIHSKFFPFLQNNLLFYKTKIYLFDDLVCTGIPGGGGSS